MIARLKRGDVVRVKAAGTSDEWCKGWVALASDTNPSSVAVMLHDMVRMGNGYVGGVLPIMVDYEAETITGLADDLYEMEMADDELAET
jgi:hypothetical protein